MGARGGVAAVNDLHSVRAEEHERDWRIEHAQAAESDVRLIQRWLHETDELLERFEDDDGVMTEMRAVAALMRMRRDDLAEEARKMRARAHDQ